MGDKHHTPAALPLGKKPGTYYAGRWVGPRADLKGSGKSRPTGIRTMDRSARSDLLYRLSYHSPKNLIIPLSTSRKDLFVSRLLLPHMTVSQNR